jgi:hypothetical protein
MYGLPADLDLSALAGREIHEVHASEHGAALRLAGGYEISLECPAQLNSQVVPFEALPGLQGRVIYSATPCGEDSVLILLDDGSRLVLQDANEAFESFQISGPGLSLVV